MHKYRDSNLSDNKELSWKGAFGSKPSVSISQALLVLVSSFPHKYSAAAPVSCGPTQQHRPFKSLKAQGVAHEEGSLGKFDSQLKPLKQVISFEEIFLLRLVSKNLN